MNKRDRLINHKGDIVLRLTDENTAHFLQHDYKVKVEEGWEKRKQSGGSSSSTTKKP